MNYLMCGPLCAVSDIPPAELFLVMIDEETHVCFKIDDGHGNQAVVDLDALHGERAYPVAYLIQKFINSNGIRLSGAIIVPGLDVGSIGIGYRDNRNLDRTLFVVDGNLIVQGAYNNMSDRYDLTNGTISSSDLSSGYYVNKWQICVPGRGEELRVLRSYENNS